jgi:hypothetical protein
MRSVCVVGGLLALVAGAATLSLSGCAIDYVGGCEGTRTCKPTEPFGDVGSAGGAGGSGGVGNGGVGNGGAGGGGGQGGEAPGPCEPHEDGATVPEECGVFVSLGGNDKAAEMNPSKQNPFKTFGAALAFMATEEYLKLNRPRNVYVCAEAFEEEVKVHEGAAIYGGLDCANDWRWVAEGRSSLTSLEDTIPLTIFGGMKTTRVENMQITAVAAKALGESSIALRVQDGNVELSRCDLQAGAGAQGEIAKADLSIQTNDSANGQPGQTANCIVLETKTEGGPGGIATQDSGACSSGGNGGDGKSGNGHDGFAGDGELNNYGLGGTLNNACTPGGAGSNGLNGSSGKGASDTDWGDITPADNTGPYKYKNASGLAGWPGTKGNGGGGGGAGHGSVGSIKCRGGAGGGGGAGGCGGNGGAPGGGGGSSIGLLSVGAQVTLESVIVRTNNGGEGGHGAAGQAGGGGGLGGLGGEFNQVVYMNQVYPGDAGCAGGNGGNGGNGGGGGGGRGGHSIGILSRNSEIIKRDATIELGTVGVGGNGGDEMNSGADGFKGDELSLP